LEDATIFILDEPTEGLDSITLSEMLTALDAIAAGKMVILISHRAREEASLLQRAGHDRMRIEPACQTDETKANARLELYAAIESDARFETAFSQPPQ
jgi:ABC-type transport system involved in cytochrome bd biosynthesis fused ATPase/permease subunit